MGGRWGRGAAPPHLCAQAAALTADSFHFSPLQVAAKYFSTQLRVWAVACYYLAQGKLSAAAHVFKGGVRTTRQEDMQPPDGAHAVRDVRNFISRTVGNFNKTGAVGDLPRSGRPHKIPHDVLLECAGAFKSGWGTTDGRWVYYTSITDAVEGPNANWYLRAVVQEFGVVNLEETLWRRMMAADPDLRRVRRPAKHCFTPEQKAARRRVAAQRADMDDQMFYLLSMVWIDCKKGWTNAQGEWVYASARDAAQPDFPVDQKAYGKFKLQFYIAVNALVGPVALIFTTGTTGLNKGYKVRGARFILVLYIMKRTPGVLRTACRAMASHTSIQGMSK